MNILRGHVQSSLQDAFHCLAVIVEASPTVHLVVLFDILFAALATLFLLYWIYIRLNSMLSLFQQRQTWIIIMKCMFDLALVILQIPEVSNAVLAISNDAWCLIWCFRIPLQLIQSSEIIFWTNCWPSSPLLPYLCNNLGGKFLLYYCITSNVYYHS